MSARLADPERYEGGEEPRVGDIVEDRAGLFTGTRRVLALRRLPGRTDADLIVALGAAGPRTPVTLRLIERSTR